MTRKVWCSIVEAPVYSDRCLFKLCKVIEGNKTCESCILRELEKLKATGTKVPNDTNDTNDINDIKDIKDINDIGDRSRRKTKKKSARRRPKKKSRSIQSETARQTYTTQELSKLLGRAGRTVQDMAQRGKIPAVRVGIKWRFPKEEVDRWLSDRKDGHLKTSQPEDETEPPEFQKT